MSLVGEFWSLLRCLVSVTVLVSAALLGLGRSQSLVVNMP